VRARCINSMANAIVEVVKHAPPKMRRTMVKQMSEVLYRTLIGLHERIAQALA